MDIESQTIGEEPDDVGGAAHAAGTGRERGPGQSRQKAGDAGASGPAGHGDGSGHPLRDKGDADDAGKGGDARDPRQGRTEGFRFVALCVGVSATLVAGWFVFLLWALSGWLGFEGGVSGWLQQAAPPVGILLALLNLAIARVAPAWLVVVYAVATATAVTLPYLSPGGDIVYRAWALGLIGMLGTAFGLRPLQSPGAKQDEDYPEPLPPASANADEE